MKAVKYILIALGFLVLVGAVAWFGFLRPAPPLISPQDRAQIYLMPLPAKLELGEGEFLISSDVNLEIENHSTQRVEKALDRFFSRMKSQTGFGKNSGQSKNLIVKLSSPDSDPFPVFDSDESYNLSISTDQVILSAPLEYGILHGLETLAQLIQEENGQWYIQTMEIEDKPRFPWRGLMIDVARHFLPKEVILRNLDAMATNKMNVLHWHLTDFQGFRVESRLFPKLHEMGSNGSYYTQDEIREIVQYAADRGIRVVPEFDVPGHSTSWLVGYPEFDSGPGPERPSEDFGISTHVMDPTNEDLYVFLDQVIGEMSGLFPDQYFHIGGDEVSPKRWEENEKIQSFMKENGLENPKALQAHFNKRLFEIVSKHGKNMSGWDEILNPNLPKGNITVQAWRNMSSLWDAARKGYKAILSTGYYLDHKLSAKSHYETDPFVIPGAVEIDIDTTLWKSWELEMKIDETNLEAELYLFGEGENLRGIMSFMGEARGFEEARLEGNKLNFEFAISLGTFKNEFEIKGDSLVGSASIALFNLQVEGLRNGGSDIPDGITLPKFDKIEPLTELQQQNIIGGEAAMWTEMADARTTESRIWPRASSVAEKLWSPQSMTTDIPDMYRRLKRMDDYLETLGIQHRTATDAILREITAPPFLSPLTSLVSILQEDILFNRMVIYNPKLLTTTPLDRVVDAARPESMIAYQFNQDAAKYLESKDDSLKEKLILQLEEWAAINQKLIPAYGSNERIAEIAPHAGHLEKLAGIAVQKLQGESPELSPNEIKELLTAASKGYGGTLLSVHEALQALITKN
jgi:hexosaminidase